jgi:hypothetical protein
MEIWRLRSFGHFLRSMFFLLGPVQYKWHRHGFLPPPEIQSIGGGVSPCTGRSPWTVLLSRRTYEIVRVYIRVVPLFSTCT